MVSPSNESFIYILVCFTFNLLIPEFVILQSYNCILFTISVCLFLLTVTLCIPYVTSYD